MLTEKDGHIVVWRTVKIKNIPFRITFVGSKNCSGYTSISPDIDEIIGEGETVKEAIESILLSYDGYKTVQKSII